MNEGIRQTPPAARLRRGRKAGRGGLLALAAAWLLLLLVVGAALAYAFLTHQPAAPEPTVTPPPRYEEAPAPPPLEAPPLDEAPERADAPASGPDATPAETSPAETPPAETPPADSRPADSPPAEMPSADAVPEAPSDPTDAAAVSSVQAEDGAGGDGAANAATAASDQQATQQAALPRLAPEPPAAPVGPAWQRFAMPYAGATNLPRIAVVVTGLGLHDDLTQRAIEELPPGITLSFSPYARGVETWMAQARAKGHEVMLDLPMEPQSYPNSDPGHFALFVSRSHDENLEQLREILRRGSAYVGLSAVMGSRFTADAEALRPILTALGDRGLIFLDNRESDAGVAAELGRQLGVPTLYNDRTLDGEFVQANAIDSRLAQVERLARTKGVAVAMANVYPSTFRQLSLWSESLREKGLALAPITAVLGRQPPAE